MALGEVDFVADSTERFLEKQKDEGQYESTGSFSLDPEALKRKYSSVLESDHEALLFFAQAAERLGASRVIFSIARKSFLGEVSLAEPDSGDLPLGDLDSLMRAEFSKEHILFELSHCYKILTSANSTRSVLLIRDEKTLQLKWEFSTSSSLFDRRSADIHSFLESRLYLSCVTNFDVRRIEAWPYPETLVRKFLQSGEEAVIPVALIHPGDSDPLEKKHEELEFPRRIKGHECQLKVRPKTEHCPVFLGLLEDPTRRAIILRYSTTPKHGSYLVPVRHGTLLEPIKLEEDFGRGFLFFNANSLQTDFSGLNLVRNEDYQRAAKESKLFWIELIQALRDLAPHYQPVIERETALMRSAGAAVGVPLVLAGGLVFGGAPLLLKSALCLKLLAGSSVLGFAQQAQYAVKPDSFTERKRNEMLAWLERLPSCQELRYSVNRD